MDRSDPDPVPRSKWDRRDPGEVEIAAHQFWYFRRAGLIHDANKVVLDFIDPFAPFAAFLL